MKKPNKRLDITTSTLEHDTCTEDTNMGSEITHSDTVSIAKGEKKKRKRKRGMKPDILMKSDLVHQPMGDDNPLHTDKNCSSNDRSGSVDTKNNYEADMVPACQSTEHNVQALNDSVSKETGLGTLQAKKKRKRKSHGKSLESLSSGNDNHVSEDQTQRPVVDTSATLVSEVVRHDAELGQDADIINDRPGRTNAKNNTEVNVPAFQGTDHNVQACNEDISQVTDLGNLQAKKKRKRKSRGKSVESLSSGNDNHVSKDQSQRPVVDTSATLVSEVVRHDAELGQDADIINDRPGRTNAKNNTEVNVPAFQGTDHNVQACNEDISQVTDLGSLQAKKKRKRKSRGKSVESLSSGNDNHVSKDQTQRPVVDTFATIVSEVVRHDAELGQDADISKDRLGITNAKNNSEVNVVPDFQGADHNAQACNENVSRKTALGNLQVKKKIKRKSRGIFLESLNDNRVSEDQIQRPVVDTCATLVSEVLQHDAELGQDADISKDIPGRTNAKNNSEVNVVPVFQGTNHNVQACNENVYPENALGNLQAKKKKKRKSRGISLESLSSGNDNHASKDEIQRPVVDTYATLDSEVVQHDAELGLDADISKDMPGRTNAKNNSEVNVVPVFQGTNHNVQACNENVSPETALGNLQAKKKKKRKSRGIRLESLSSGNDNHASKDEIQQPVVDTCATLDSEVVQHDTELGQDADNRKGIRDTSVESNDNSNSSRDKHSKITDTKTHKENAIPVNEIAESNDLVCPYNGSGKLAKKATRNNRKRDQKVVTSNPGVSSTEIIQHNAEPGITEEKRKEMDQNAFANDKNCSRMDSSGIVDNKNNSEAKVVPLSHGTEHTRICDDSVSKETAFHDLQTKKKRKENNGGGSSNLESEEGANSCIDLSGKQMVKRGQVNTGENVLCVSGSADDTLEEYSRTCTERIALGEQSFHSPMNVFMERTLSGCFRKKLLILDLNGLLADIVQGNTGSYKADGNAGLKKVFKRPFCEDFLQFCFDRFTVGVWSSRRGENVDKVIKVIMGENRSKLAFIWDQAHCTETGEFTIGNREKPLLLKEIAKLWENNDGTLPWKEGDYTRSNTLLLDDSPYKALRNPPNTAIFPNPYQYRDQKDNSLGPDGDLRTYLDGLASADDVQEYVKKNPFGQKSITESNPSWKFYVKVRDTILS